jgi:hypothetical protein
MNSPNDILLDIESEMNSKSRLLPALLVLFTASILLIFITFGYRLYYSAIIRNFEKAFFLIIVSIPTVGALLFALKKKFGYTICFFYYELMTLSFLAVIFQRLIESENRELGPIAFWTPYCIAALSLLITLIILTKDIRAYMSISTKRLRQTVVISTLLVLAFLILLSQN